MQSEFKYSLVLIAVNRGFTDSVMQTAKKAGATGGTVIKARHAEAEIVSICGGQPVYDFIISVE